MTPARRLNTWFLILVALIAVGSGYCQTQSRLIGTSTFGGGSIFSQNLDGSGFATHKTFYPEGDVPTGLADGNDGFFYGMTTQGGSAAVGVIYKIKPDGSQFSVLHEFQGTDGSQPSGKLMMASNGFLYGMTKFGGTSDKGVIFRLSSDGTGFQVLKHLNDPTGMYPEGSLIETGSGTLVGVTHHGGLTLGGFGVIFSLQLDGSNFNLLHVFQNTDGDGPVGKLLQLNDGLYGMTTYGGTNNVGTIYKIQSNGSGFTTLYSFNATTGGYWPFGDLILGLDDQLYGMTQNSATPNVGTIFKIARGGSNFINFRDFNSPITVWDFQHTSLVQDANGILYGTALSSLINHNNGVLFKMNADGSGYQDLITATAPGNTDFPTGELIIDSNGILYGISKGQAVYADRNDLSRSVQATYIDPSKIFSLNPSNLAYQELKSFVSPVGGTPRADLISGSGDVLFGTTFRGGLNNRGVLYSINSSGSNYQPLYHFSESTGGGPLGPLYRSPSGDIYGTTTLGGSFGQGILFRVHEDGSAYAVLHEFDDQPTGLTYYNGDFYGTTTGGSGIGYIFRIHDDGSAFIKLYTFTNATGIDASGPVTAGPDGTLYGMTMSGGSSGYGVIYSMASDGTNYTVLMEFDGTNGRGPAGSLLYGVDGTLFGMSYGDIANTFHSQIFNVWPGGIFSTTGTNFRQMAGTNGNTGVGNLIQAPSGELYGAVQAGSGSTANTGFVFQINIDPNDFQSIHDLTWTNGIPLTSLKYAEVPTEDQTITFSAPPTKNFGDLPFQLTATSSSGLPVSYMSSDLSVATVSGNVITIVGVGSSAITASQPGNGIFNPALDVVQTLIVNKGTQVITFNPPPPKTLIDPPFTPASISSGLPIAYTSSDPSVATISGQTVILVGAGSTDITASQAGNANYNPAPDVTHTLTVSKASQAITFNPVTTKNFGDTPFNLTATSNSGLTVTYVSTNTLVATVSGNTVTITGGGSTTFIASQAGNNVYDPASDVTQSFTVNKANQTITFGSISAKTLIDPPFSLSATSSSGLTVTYVSSNTAVATVSGNTVTIVSAGTTNITASQSGNNTYNAASDVIQPLSVGKASQTITFPSIPVKTLTDPSFSLSATASSGLAVTYVSTNTAVATVSGNTVTIVSVGTTNIIASQAGNSIYNSALNVTQPLVVNKLNQTITFLPIAPKIIGDPAFSLSATSSSGLSVTYVSTNTSVATVAVNIVTIVGVGSTNIIASQAGNTLYNSALDVTQPLVVNNKLSQTITFPAIPTKTFGEGAFTLSATSDSGLAVQYSTTSDKIIFIANQVFIVKPGSVTINADQPGNAIYGAAAQASQTFCINPSKPAITITGINTPAVKLTSSADTGNQWYLNGVIVPGAINQTYLPVGNGNFTVLVTVDGCVSTLSNQTPLIITGDLHQALNEKVIVLYPNPAKDELIVLLEPFKKGQAVDVIIYDLTGKRLDQVQGLGQESLRLNVGAYPTGMYLIKVVQEGNSSLGKFVKE